MVKVRPWVPYLYCAPLMALLAFIFGYPIVKVVDFSTRLVRGSSGPFIGLDNYRNAIDDPTFRNAARHSATLLLAVPVLLAISVLVSVLLYDQMRGWRIYRSVLFMPYILAVPIVGIVACYMFTLHGVVNDLLAKVGLKALAIDWIGSEHYALMTVLIVIIWREVGFGIVLFLARLMSQDEGPLEAARIDGASWWQRLWHVILPELRGTIEFYVVIAATTVRGVRVRLRLDAHAGRAGRRHDDARGLHLQHGRGAVAARPGRGRRDDAAGRDVRVHRAALLGAPPGLARGGGGGVKPALSPQPAASTSCCSSPARWRSARCCSCS